VFAECVSLGIQQTRLCRVRCKIHTANIRHLAKIAFAECFISYTRQKLCLPSATKNTLDKELYVPAMCTRPLPRVEHSTNCVGFAKCLPSWHSASPPVGLPRCFFFREPSQHSAKVLLSAWYKVLDKQLFAITLDVVWRMSWVALGKVFAECDRHSVNTRNPVVILSFGGCILWEYGQE